MSPTIGGGKLARQILGCMELAAVKRMKTYSRYGSDTFKQVYIYGGLHLASTTLNRVSTCRACPAVGC